MNNKELFIYGIVDPREWNWKNEGLRLLKIYEKSPYSYVKVDICKYIGLLQRLEELENKQVNKKKQNKPEGK